MNDTELMILYLLLYFLSFYLCMLCFTNKNNYNDNTSGVSVILSLLEKNKNKINKKIAYVLFDNEEKGLVGSKLLKKDYVEVNNKILINFDCVGNGKNILLSIKDKAKENQIYRLLEETIVSNELFNIKFLPSKKCLANSDQKNFDQGIVVVACKYNKILGYYTNKIHTNKDKEIDIQNIEYLSEKFNEFIEKI